MRLFFDLNLQRFVIGPSTTQEETEIQVKRGPATEIEIQFLREVTPQELSSSAAGIFEVKTTGEYDSSPLTAAMAWVKTGTGEDTIYTFTLPLVNDPLDALLAVDELVTFVTAFATDTFTATAHGLADTTIIQLSSTVTLPAPLLPNTDYFVRDATANTFKLALTSGGAAINLANDGSGIHSFHRTTNDIESVELMAAMQFEEDGKTTESQTLIFILENDVVREGDIPPAFPALVYAVFLPEILTMADFKAVPTVGMSLGYLVEILIDVSGTFTWLTYRLESGPVTEAEPQHVEPDDYDLGTNNVHWNGAAGPAGPAGKSAGLAYKFNTATTGDPTSGRLLWNNATISSATQINIHETDDDGNAIAALIATWDDSTSATKGFLVIRDPATVTNFAVFRITGTLTDVGAYDTFPVAHVSSGGSFSNGLAITVEFIAKGDAAATPSITQNYSSTTTDADPGSGIFRLNAVVASATAAYLDNNEAGGNSITAFLDAFDDSTNTAKGTLIFRGITSPTAFAIYAVTGSVVDGTGYRKLTLTYQSSGGTFTTGELFSIAFYRAGNAGPGYTATSATSFSIGTGSKAFTTQANLAYTVGARARASSAANTANYLEGLVTAYSSTTLTILVDVVGGSGGPFTDWNINLAGEPGTDGDTTYVAAATIPAGASPNIDWATVTVGKRRTLGANTTFTHINKVDGKTIIIPILNTVTNYSVTWVGVDYWQGTGGVAPTQSPGNVVDVYTFFYDGTYTYGAWAPGI